MQITGKITKVLPVRTGMTKKGGTWAAQQFVLTTDVEPKVSILLEVFGQKEIDSYGLAEGQTVTVTYSPYVNESGDKVFGKNNVSAVEHTDNPMTGVS